MQEDQVKKGQHLWLGLELLVAAQVHSSSGLERMQPAANAAPADHATTQVTIGDPG